MCHTVSVMKIIHIDLYTFEMTKVSDADFKLYTEGVEGIESRSGTVYAAEEYLVIVVK